MKVLVIFSTDIYSTERIVLRFTNNPTIYTKYPSELVQISLWQHADSRDSFVFFGPTTWDTQKSLEEEDQREGMGLLEYQAMPSLREVTYDGWLCTCTVTAAGNSISSQLGSSCKGNRYSTVKAGGTVRPSRTSHLPGHSPLASQAGRRVGPAL
jgi:hypothetical protein